MTQIQLKYFTWQMNPKGLDEVNFVKNFIGLSMVHPEKRHQQKSRNRQFTMSDSEVITIMHDMLQYGRIQIFETLLDQLYARPLSN